MLTAKEYKQALKKVEALMSLDPNVGSPRGKTLIKLADRIEAYESLHYPSKPIAWHTKARNAVVRFLESWHTGI